MNIDVYHQTHNDPVVIQFGLLFDNILK